MIQSRRRREKNEKKMKKSLKMFVSCGVLLAAASLVAETEFANGYTWTYRINGDSAEIYNGGSCAISPAPTGAVTIPDTLGCKPVASIGDCAFYGCSGLTGVTMPDSVTNIGVFAFSSCRGLTRLVIPDGVTSIGDWAFNYCNCLASVTISDGVTSIGNQAFYYCRGLASVTIPDSVTTIGSEAFYGCSSLTNVTIGTGVTSIGTGTFSECSSLARVMIPVSVKSIGPNAFSCCGSLTSVTIPDSVTSIGSGAFFSCISLASVTIPDSVAYIGGQAFHWCRGLLSVKIPQTVCDYSFESVFQSCDSITNIVLSENVSSIYDGTFQDCVSLEEITFLSSIESIGAGAFNNCSNLSRLRFCGNGAVSVGALPYPKTERLKLSNWLSSPDGGEEMMPNSGEVPAGSVYYAHWTQRIPTSADLEFPDSMTVGDEDYNWFSSDGAKTWTDRVIVYDQDGDVIPPDSYYIDIFRFNEEQGYEESIERYPKAGEYSVRVSNSTECWIVKTFRIEKAYYEMPNGFECLVDGNYPSSGYGSVYNLGCFTNSAVVEVRGWGATSTIRVYDYDKYYTLSWGYDPVYNSWRHYPSYRLGCSDESHYSITQDYNDWQIIQFNTAGRYVIEVSTGESWWEDDWSCTRLYGTTETMEVYVEPLPLSDLEIVAESDLVYTGEAIENNYSDYWNTGNGFSLYNGKLRISVPETSLFVENPVAVTNAGTYRIALGVNMDETTSPCAPYADDSHPVEDWRKYNPLVEGHNSWGGDGYYTDGVCYAFNYTGLVYVAYTVLPRPVSAGQARVVPCELHCDGTEQTCSLMITNDYNGVVLVEGRDYDVAYANNILAGMATATVTCKGNYTGTFSQEFEILPSTNVVEVLGLDKKWTTGGDKEWFAEWFEPAHDGVSCMRSGKIDNLQESWIETVVINTGVVSFWWRASSEAYKDEIYDFVRFTVDGVAVATLGGETDWTNVIYVVVGDGPHALRWTYLKDESDFGGQDCAWLDEVQYLREVQVSFDGGGATDGVAPDAMVVGEGATISLPAQASLTWPKHRFVGWRLGIDLFDIGASFTLGYDDVVFTAAWEEKHVTAPAISVAGRYETESTTVTMTCETQGAYIRYTLDGSDPTAESALYTTPFALAGTATIKAIAVLDDWFDSEVVSAESVRAPWTPGECLNVPAMNFRTGGDAEWARDLAVMHDGEAAMHSGAIGDGQISWIETSVYAAGTLTFWWKVSSESYKGRIYDYARFTVDGEMSVPDIGGEVGWRNEIVTIAGGGVHTIRWTYVKDAQDKNGEDCAWLDEVTWTPAEVFPAIVDNSEIAEVLNGAADEASLAAHITTKYEYDAFLSWADGKGLAHALVKDAPNAWLSYALDAPGLMVKATELASEDVVIESIESSIAEAGAFDLVVNIADAEIGEGAQLAEALGVEGATELNESAFSSEGLAVMLERTADGKAKATVAPDGAPPAFFLRVKVK